MKKTALRRLRITNSDGLFSRGRNHQPVRAVFGNSIPICDSKRRLSGDVGQPWRLRSRFGLLRKIGLTVEFSL
jgi:hypothetical protein